MTDSPTAHDCTAQDVVDALRLAFMAQKDPLERERLVELMLELGPKTDSNRGVNFLLNLLAEGSLKVTLIDD